MGAGQDHFADSSRSRASMSNSPGSRAIIRLPSTGSVNHHRAGRARVFGGVQLLCSRIGTRTSPKPSRTGYIGGFFAALQSRHPRRLALSQLRRAFGPMQGGGRTAVLGTMQEGIGAAASAPERIIGRKLRPGSAAPKGSSCSAQVFPEHIYEQRVWFITLTFECRRDLAAGNALPDIHLRQYALHVCCIPILLGLIRGVVVGAG